MLKPSLLKRSCSTSARLVPAQVRDDAAATREWLRRALDAVTDTEWTMSVSSGETRHTLGERVGDALDGDMGPGTHAVEHAGAIHAWRAEREGPSTTV